MGVGEYVLVAGEVEGTTVGEAEGVAVVGAAVVGDAVVGADVVGVAEGEAEGTVEGDAEGDPEGEAEGALVGLATLVHSTPASSECKQLCSPIGLCSQSKMLVSLP